MKKNFTMKRLEPFIFLGILSVILYGFISTMGISNFFGTLIATSYDLLINTVFFIMALAVVMGAFAGILGEFGVVDLLNALLSKVMRLFYNLPGVCSLGIVSTYLSDNPAIIALAKDKKFVKKLDRKQIVTLCNLGTSFGMGLIITTYFISIDTNNLLAVIVGNIAAVIGSIISVRIMQRLIRNVEFKLDIDEAEVEEEEEHTGTFDRVMNSLLEGGKKGVEIGLEIIPGVLIISTIVLMLTNGTGADGVYTGSAGEGIGLLPYIAAKLDFILNPIFGFSSSEAIAFPLTALGSTGAALGFYGAQYETLLFTAKDVAVFTAIGMTWSGYLSTHIGMMDALGARKLVSKAIISHTIAGIGAAIVANYLYMFVSSI